jgi:undecaprenyl-diphosphatase
MISKLNRAQVLALATVAVIGFAAIQLGMASTAGRTPAWDKTVMEKVRDCSERFGAPFTTHLNETIRDISALGGMTVLGMLSVAISGYFLLRRDYSASALLLASWLGGWGSMNGLKYLYGRARPDIVQKLQEATGYSFPSGHTMVATVVYLTLAFILIDRLEKRWTRIYVIAFTSLLTFLIGFSRVYLGVHYPSDVLGGWGFGLIFVLGIRLAVQWNRFENSIKLHKNVKSPELRC